MIVLGIDPGLANTGWAIVETQGPLARARAYGCITTQASEPMNVRLFTIARELSAVIDRYHPTCMAIEEVFFGRNTRSAIATAHARGAAMLTGASLGLEVGEYTPMQIKQGVVGTGSADKKQVTYMVRRVLELDHDPTPDHAADALAVAVCHANLSRTLARARESLERVSSAKMGAHNSSQTAAPNRRETS